MAQSVPHTTGVTMAKAKPVQGSLFEENYLLRTLGTIAHVPDVALMELVANAWDAGASEVRITIPDQRDPEKRMRIIAPPCVRSRWRHPTSGG